MAKMRLNLVLSVKLHDDLQAIASETGVRMTDILQQGIAFLKVAIEAKQKGFHLGIVDDASKLDRELVGLL